MRRGKGRFLWIVGSVAALLLLFGGAFLYATRYRYTEVDVQTSLDGRCELTLEMRGEPEWPFGATYGRILMRYDGETVGRWSITVHDDGAVLRPENWSVTWGLEGAEVTLTGSEQGDQVLELLYDGTGRFSGYSDEEIIAEIRTRYPGVRVLGMEGGYYVFDAGDFSFLVQNDLPIRDNYRMEQYRYLTDAYFAGRNRAHEYEESGNGARRVYIPVISLHSSQSEEKEWFCSDITNWLLSCVEELPYAGNEDIYTEIRIAYGADRFSYELQNVETLSEANVAEVYNALYEFIESKMNSAYENQVAEGRSDGRSQSMAPVSNEQAEYYLSLEAECSYVTADGVEYRMIPVDRALGSSFYVMLATADGGESALFVNPDPYRGSGGGSRWISFLEDGNTGFSCLTHSGGSSGSLYRTGDGGRSFEEVEYPSAMIELPDGTYYNPFVMPERVYEEGGKLYLVAGQGAYGDHYGEEGYSSGLYESEDNGKTWKYVREIPAER